MGMQLVSNTNSTKIHLNEKDVEIISLDVSLKDVNLLYECKRCYIIFQTIDTLKLHNFDCYAEAYNGTTEHNLEGAEVITIDGIQPVYVNLISEADIHIEPPEDTEYKAGNTRDNDGDWSGNYNTPKQLHE